MKSLTTKQAEAIAAIKSSDSFMILASDIAPVIGADPQCIRSQAKADPKALGFPVSIIGDRLYIPRIPFLNFLGVHEND